MDRRQYREEHGNRTPLYVTRPTAQGVTGTFYVSPYIALVGFIFVWTNLVLWGIAGIVYWSVITYRFLEANFG